MEKGKEENLLASYSMISNFSESKILFVGYEMVSSSSSSCGQMETLSAPTRNTSHSIISLSLNFLLNFNSLKILLPSLFFTNNR